MTLEPEVIAGVAMLGGAARLFFLVAKRAKHERTQQQWRDLIASAHTARTPVAQLAEQGPFTSHDRGSMPRGGIAHNARTPKGRAVTRDPLRRLHVPRG